MRYRRKDADLELNFPPIRPIYLGLPVVNSPTLRATIAAVAEPTLDLERIAMLRDLCVDADPSMLTEMLGAWSRESLERLNALRSAVTTRDANAVRNAAHALKGSCANLGVPRLSEMSRLLEKTPEVSDLAEVIHELAAEFERANQQLSAELQGQKA